IWCDDVTSICHCERSPFDSLRSLGVNSAESRSLINYFKLWITQISFMSFRGSRPPSRSFMRRSGGISRRLFNRGLCGRRLARSVNYYENSLKLQSSDISVLCPLKATHFSVTTEPQFTQQSRRATNARPQR